jgi:hypothetical protein
MHNIEWLNFTRAEEAEAAAAAAAAAQQHMMMSGGFEEEKVSSQCSSYWPTSDVIAFCVCSLMQAFYGARSGGRPAQFQQQQSSDAASYDDVCACVRVFARRGWGAGS